MQTPMKMGLLCGNTTFEINEELIMKNEELIDKSPFVGDFFNYKNKENPRRDFPHSFFITKLYLIKLFLLIHNRCFLMKYR
jgi:hypothetical protein